MEIEIKMNYIVFDSTSKKSKLGNIYHIYKNYFIIFHLIFFFLMLNKLLNKNKSVCELLTNSIKASKFDVFDESTEDFMLVFL